MKDLLKGFQTVSQGLGGRVDRWGGVLSKNLQFS